MYTPVSFIYDDMDIYQLLVVVTRTITGEIWYHVCGLSHSCSEPVFIGGIGAFTDAEKALNNVIRIAKKYPPLASRDNVPNFDDYLSF